MPELIFSIKEEQPALIKVIGVGGGGCNAVRHMYDQGIVGVNFVVCNTDAQALNQSPVPNKIQLGPNLTKGRGAGSLPEIGKEATIESLEEVKEAIGEDTQMLFVTAGMGGGTGTGGSPIVAQKAQEMGILTVGIVTLPFVFEGPKRVKHAKAGIEEMRKYVDTLLVINNDRVNELYSSATVSDAYAHADDVLVNAAKSIAEIITVTGLMNVDFADVNTVMRNGGVAIMGSAIANGENRAMSAATKALNSPLLNDNNIRGAKDILINIRYGEKEALLEEISKISTYIQHEAGDEPNIILGVGPDDSLKEDILVTVLATGFEQDQDSVNISFKSGDKVLPTSPVVENKEKTVPTLNTITVAPGTAPDEDVNEVYLSNLRANDKNEAKPQASNASDTGLNEEEEETPIGFNIEKPQEPAINAIFKLTNNEPGSPSTEEEDELKQRYQKSRRRERLSQYTENKYENADVNELEKQPAYMRRQDIAFMDVPKEGNNEISRFTLSRDSDGETSIKKNGSMIHDKPD